MFRFAFPFLLAVLSLNGCGTEANNPGGSGGAAGDAGSGGGGDGGMGGVDLRAWPCTEQGIRDAIAEGGGPHFFACDGPTVVTSESDFVIANDVVLDGEGNLTVDRRFRVLSTVELRGFGVSDVYNSGHLTLVNSVVNPHGVAFDGIDNFRYLVVVDSTVRGFIRHLDGMLTVLNSSVDGFISSGDPNSAGESLKLENSTVSGGIDVLGRTILTLTNSTISGRLATSDIVLSWDWPAVVTMARSLVDGSCAGLTMSSIGYNIESPGDTCGFDPDGTDQVNVTEGELNLGELADNGGPTETYALGEASVAIDVIPEAECLDTEGEPLTEDQRGEPRPGGAMCDVGAFEVQP